MLRNIASLFVRQAWIKKAAVTIPGVRGLAWRFVAGEDLDAATRVVRELGSHGIKATLNYIGEHVRAEAEAVAASEATIECLRRLASERLDANVSVKLTNLGLDVSEELCRELLGRIIVVARQVGGFVRVDMEASRYVDTTLRLFEGARDAHGTENVGIVLQSYLRQRAGDLDRLVAAGSRVRLVKGGYWEPADVAFRKKADVDAAFARDIERLVKIGRDPAIATHDADAIAWACHVATEAAIDRRAIEFQMLYGVRSDLQADLVRRGFPVRAYVPYGTRWHDYALGCVRRLPATALRHLGERVRARRDGVARPSA